MKLPEKAVRVFLLSAAVLLSVSAAVIYTMADPEESMFFPRCLFHLLTGLYCPGCGLQRAFHQLLNGHVLEAASYNALLVAAIPYVLLWAVLKFLPCRNRFLVSAREVLYGYRAAWLVLCIVVAFWILRNIFPCISPGLHG